MSRVLIMSSWTSVGDVGLAAAAPVLQALGHDVTQLPTIILSNHPAWPRFAGQTMAPERLAEMIDALDANGLLDGHDALLTGYLPSAAHVALACDIVDRLARRGPRPKVVVDPILGDDPKGLYLAEEAALAVRDSLLPLADIMTPNCFELGWLTGRSVATLAEVRAAAASLTTRVAARGPCHFPADLRGPLRGFRRRSQRGGAFPHTAHCERASTAPGTPSPP